MSSFAAAQEVYAAGLIFARIGALLMLIPGYGEAVIPPRIRLAFALSFTLLMLPILSPAMPPVPGTVGGLAGGVIKELLVGLMVGGILRMFLSSLATAGEIVSLQTTLSFAQTAAPGQAQPSTSLSTFLGLMGIVLIMTTDLHHMFLGAVVKSYTVFPVTRDIPLADGAALAVQTLGRSFALGLQLAAPVVAFALIFNIAAGLVGRAMPQFQVFFVATPLMLLLGLSLFALTLGAAGMVWVDRYRDLISRFA